MQLPLRWRTAASPYLQGLAADPSLAAGIPRTQAGTTGSHARSTRSPGGASCTARTPVAARVWQRLAQLRKHLVVFLHQRLGLASKQRREMQGGVKGQAGLLAGSCCCFPQAMATSGQVGGVAREPVAQQACHCMPPAATPVDFADRTIRDSNRPPRTRCCTILAHLIAHPNAKLQSTPPNPPAHLATLALQLVGGRAHLAVPLAEGGVQGDGHLRAGRWVGGRGGEVCGTRDAPSRRWDGGTGGLVGSCCWAHVPRVQVHQPKQHPVHSTRVHRTARHRTAPHTAPRRTAPHRTACHAQHTAHWPHLDGQQVSQQLQARGLEGAGGGRVRKQALVRLTRVGAAKSQGGVLGGGEAGRGGSQKHQPGTSKGSSLLMIPTQLVGLAGPELGVHQLPASTTAPPDVLTPRPRVGRTAGQTGSASACQMSTACPAPATAGRSAALWAALEGGGARRKHR